VPPLQRTAVRPSRRCTTRRCQLTPPPWGYIGSGNRTCQRSAHTSPCGQAVPIANHRCRHPVLRPGASTVTVDPLRHRTLRLGSASSQLSSLLEPSGDDSASRRHWIDVRYNLPCDTLHHPPSGHPHRRTCWIALPRIQPVTLARLWYGWQVVRSTPPVPGRIQMTGDRTAIPSCDSTRLVITARRWRTTEQPCVGAQLRIPEDSAVPEEQQIGLRPIRSTTLCLQTNLENSRPPCDTALRRYRDESTRRTVASHHSTPPGSPTETPEGSDASEGAPTRPLPRERYGWTATDLDDVNIAQG